MATGRVSKTNLILNVEPERHYPHVIVGILFAKKTVSYMKGDNMRNLIILMFSLCFTMNTIHAGIVPKFVKIEKKQLTCLVENAYHEAMGEGKVGRLLVTQVVLNRAREFNQDYCSVIYAYKQFSWTLFKKKQIDKKIRKVLEYEILVLLHSKRELPRRFLEATHFHTTAVKPYWASTKQYLGTYKNHKFYVK